MTAVIRIKIEENIGIFPSGDNQSVFVAHSGGEAEGTIVVVRLLAVLDVGETMGCPETLKLIWNPRETRGRPHIGVC
ncbi:MAG: hypothetical protein ACJAS7_000823 [Alpinimonas sp.]|jgi:hypothetical protein